MQNPRSDAALPRTTSNPKGKKCQGREVIEGYHFIFSAYGFWLPNDPRGSWSITVRQFDLLKYGPATKVTTTRSVAARPHDHQRRLAAKRALRYPPVRLTGHQAVAVAEGFGDALATRAYAIHALAILPDHVHLILARHSIPIDQIAAHLKAKATASLARQNLHPMERFATSQGRKPSPWARNYWAPFIRTPQHMRAAIRYVENNPVKAGLRAQRWSLVVPYDG